jgi:hypothetical protein
MTDSQPIVANPALSIRETAPKRDEESGILLLAPQEIEETGLSPSFLMELAMKVIHYAESPSAEHVARVMAIPPKIVESILDSLKTDRLCEIVGGGQQLRPDHELSFSPDREG